MSSIYRAIFRQSLSIVWKFKFLWFFGVFAALASGAGEVNLFLDNFPQVSKSASFLETLRAMYQESIIGGFGTNLWHLIASLGWVGWLLVLLLLVLFVFLVWLAIVSQVGLLSAAYKIFKKQKAGFNDIFQVGRQKFWPVLWLNLLGRLVIWLIWLIIGLPLAVLYLSQGSGVEQTLFVVLAFIILLPLAIIVSFLVKYAVLFNVTKKKGVKASLTEAWRLFIKNWLVSIEMAILVFFSGLATVIVLAITAGIVSVPLSLIILIFASLKLSNLMYLTLIFSFIILLLIIVWVGAMWSVFRHTAWTILFVRISEGQVLAKLVRLVAGKSAIKE